MNSVEAQQSQVCNHTCTLGSGSVTWRETINNLPLIYSNQEHNLPLPRALPLVKRRLGADTFFNHSDSQFNDTLLPPSIINHPHKHLPLQRRAIIRTLSVVLLGEFSRVVSSCHYRDELEEVQQCLPQRSTGATRSQENKAPGKRTHTSVSCQRERGRTIATVK